MFGTNKRQYIVLVRLTKRRISIPLLMTIRKIKDLVFSEIPIWLSIKLRLCPKKILKLAA